jgi:hypothetical protein
LKLEPREASRILIPHAADLQNVQGDVIEGGIAALQSWRHYGE